LGKPWGNLKSNISQSLHTFIIRWHRLTQGFTLSTNQSASAKKITFSMKNGRKQLSDGNNESIEME
jgi:hypothetical protein